MRPSRASTRALATALIVSTLAPVAVWSTPKNRSAFFAAYPGAVGSRLDNLPSNAGHCGVCHYDFNGGGARNLFGARVEAVLPNYPNTNDGKRLAILSIHDEDNDGDGRSNGVEITDLVNFSNTPTFPGLQSSNVGSVTNVDINDILNYLTPQSGSDTQPPVVNLTSPNGGQVWAGGSGYAVTWIATDNVAVTTVDLFYRDDDDAPWVRVARDLMNPGTHLWFVPNTPTATARVKVLARDAAGNIGTDSSSASFTIVRSPGGIIASTLRDFEQPGTQPLDVGGFETSATCVSCHGGYDAAVEPGSHFKGTMMGQAARDPLFYACLAIAEQDAPSSGDMCIRCHSPMGWLGGRSTPTDASQLTQADRDGVACDFCHRGVNPVYTAGASPPEDQAILDGMLPAHRPTNHSNGQFVTDPIPRKRGPFSDPVAPHATIASAFHRSSDFCGTCHDVSNPAFDRIAGADYAPGPLDQAADSISSLTLFPLERTYSEWKASAFPGGVYAPEFAGNKPDGIVSTCQDCHMSDVLGKGCNDPAAPTRADLPRHDLTGGNTWLGRIIARLYPGETDSVALEAGAVRARALLRKSALVDLAVAAEGDSFRATVTVTNRTGHKLPTGYPEGRRMWLQLVARDGNGNVVFESGAWDPATGLLAEDPQLVVYEAHLGISPPLAGAIGLPHGPSFHFALNDSVYKDNRIPPAGFTNAAFAAFGGAPVDETRPGPRYADGQNWDVSGYALPATARSASVRLLYQTTSKEYVEFLRDHNTTNSAGQLMYDLWAQNGKAPPESMAEDSATFAPLGVGDDTGRPLALTPLANPFRGELALRLDLPRPAGVVLEVHDVFGRRIARRDLGVLGAGPQRILWDGRAGGATAAPGLYWVRVRAAGETVTRVVTRLR